MEVEKAILLESGFDELHGVDWGKGCYMGQELTARTKYRALVKRRLVPVDVDGPVPPPGTPVIFEGKDVGEIRSGGGGVAMALIRLTALEQVADANGSGFTADNARVTPVKPAWAVF
jgi:folate-binding protein YgfZ